MIPRLRRASGTAFAVVTTLAVIGAVALVPIVATTSDAAAVIEQSGGEVGVSLCRYGVDALGSIADYPVEDLRMGWYIDFGMSKGLGAADPQYMPIIGLEQTASGTYGLRGTDPATIAAKASAYPSQTWIIGNEPDSPYQDKLEPQAYAEAYHDLYYLIKSADPTAQIATGAIVQPTPVRLLYLDMVLDSYRQRYGEPMPVDMWNIHVYIIQERSCDYYPDDCWGAEMPPGIAWPEGELYSIDDNANVEVFKELVRSFRGWMARRGYRDRPLIISEFGVQMPADYGFPPDRVNAYMNETFDFLRTETGDDGYPADDNRLVQRWAWWSLNRPLDDEGRPDTNWPLNNNGWLYDPFSPPQRTVFGDNYAAYTAQVQATVDLLPAKMWAATSRLSSGEPVTVTLSATVANAGEVAYAGGGLARFYLGVAPDTSNQIGSDLTIEPLSGCGSSHILTVTLRNVSPGSHPVYLVVDPDEAVPESDELNNVLAHTVFIGTEHVMLPLVQRD